ncbi:hypothetical protein ACWEFL_19780 [Streptomyces sp. NPDC004838]
MSHALPALVAVLTAAADRMIPPEGDWPLPSGTALEGFLGDALRSRESDARTVRGIRARLDGLCDGDFPSAPGAAQDAALISLEAADPAAFRTLRELVYYGYYSRPEVAEVIRKVLDCDYHSPPQPLGYRIDDAPFLTPPARGHYTPTSAMRSAYDRTALHDPHDDRADRAAIGPGAGPSTHRKGPGAER